MMDSMINKTVGMTLLHKLSVLICIFTGLIVLEAADLPESICSHDMSLRSIPYLNDTIFQTFGNDINFEEDVELLQVQVIIRHGARTPVAGPVSCWKDYSIEWNCDVITLEQPSSSDSSIYEDVNNLKYPLFKKEYNNTGNSQTTYLRGTCLLGQLLVEGLNQQIANGVFLKQAYICSNKMTCLYSSDEEAVTSLIDSDTTGEVWLRSTDTQRTLISGQTLVSAFFNFSSAATTTVTSNVTTSENSNTTSTPDSTAAPTKGPEERKIRSLVETERDDDIIIPWHTADYDADRMKSNEDACPRLAILNTAASESAQYYAAIHDSADVRALNKTIISEWGVEEVDWSEVLDCIVTTFCTVSEVPYMNEQTIEQALNVSTFVKGYMLYHDNSSYSKLAMSPLITELRNNIKGYTDTTSTLKFGLWSGHDNTIMPFIAALAGTTWGLDQGWSPYASMITLELIKLKGVSFYVRMVFNGKVLTMDGPCSGKALCPLEDFLALTSFVEDVEITSCDVEESESVDSSPNEENEPNPEPFVGTSNSAQGTQYSGTVVVAFSLACFVIGLLTGAAPLLIYQRRSNYDAVGTVENSSNFGGYHYQMPELSQNARQSVQRRHREFEL